MNQSNELIRSDIAVDADMEIDCDIERDAIPEMEGQK